MVSEFDKKLHPPSNQLAKPADETCEQTWQTVVGLPVVRQHWWWLPV